MTRKDLPHDIDPQTQLELEAAAFRRLRKHLMADRPEVQNIDLMNLAGFCRNCLSRWYHALRRLEGAKPDRGQPGKAGRVRGGVQGERAEGVTLYTVSSRTTDLRFLRLLCKGEGAYLQSDTDRRFR